VEHPEGIFDELDGYDDRIWHLGVYEKCLDNWDMMNAALQKTTNDLSQGDPAQIYKLSLRYQGLTILREVDNK
jgi:hypothetical protein